LRNGNCLSHCSLFPLSLLFTPVLLSMSSSCSSSNARFCCLIPLIHLLPQLQGVICPLGFPHFYPFCWDGPFSAMLRNCLLFPLALAVAVGLTASRDVPRSEACPVLSSTQALAPLGRAGLSSPPPGTQRTIPAATSATRGRLKADPKGLQWVRVYKHKGALMQPGLGGISAPMGNARGGVPGLKGHGMCVWMEKPGLCWWR